MESLPADALITILEKLGWVDLWVISQTCSRLRAAAAPDAVLWRNLCRQRWHGPLNTHLFPVRQAATEQQQHGSWQQLATHQRPRPQIPDAHFQKAHASPSSSSTQADYKRLLANQNGWHNPQLQLQHYAGGSWSDEIVALQPNTADDGTTSIVVSSSRELRVLELGPSPQATMRVRRGGIVPSGAGAEQWASVAAVPPAAISAGGLVAAGGCNGRLALFQLPEVTSPAPGRAEAQRRAELVFPNVGSCILSELHVLPGNTRLATLHSPLALLRSQPQHSALSVVNIASWHLTGPAMTEVLDGYQLATATPVGSSGQEFLAGSVRLSEHQASGWHCPRCSPSLPASVCFHKAQASTAALLTYDLRAAQPLVSRHSCHHRSLYPKMEPLREHFFLTSHAGTPLALWDRRQLNGPVHEHVPLPRDLDPDSETQRHLPLDHPEHHDQPASQALHLSASPDVLVGRADNGMIWRWDLSDCLGWADGRRGGAWLSGRHSMGCGLADPDGGGAFAAAGNPLARNVDVDCTEEAGVQENVAVEWYGECECWPAPLGCIGAPYEAWCGPEAEETAPLHWLPLPAVWAANHRLVALGGLELEAKQQLFPAHAQGSPYPSNALVVASLTRGAAGGQVDAGRRRRVCGGNRHA